MHVESLHSPEKPLALTFDYTFKKQLRLSAGRLTGTLRAGFARDYLAPTPFTDRKTPFEKIVPLTFHSTVMLHAPAGFIAEIPDSLEMTLDPRFGTGHATVQRQGDGLELDFEFHQRTGHYPPTDYVAYQDTMNKAVAALERTVEFKADSP